MLGFLNHSNADDRIEYCTQHQDDYIGFCDKCELALLIDPVIKEELLDGCSTGVWAIVGSDGFTYKFFMIKTDADAMLASILRERE